MDTPITDQIQSSATDLINQLNASINATNVSDNAKANLMASRDSIQAALNQTFMQNGIIDQSQLDSINNTMISAKGQLLALQSQQTMTNLITWSAVGLIVIGGLIWYVKTRAKK